MNIKDYFEYWDEFLTIWKNSKNESDYKNGCNNLKNGFKELPFEYPEGIKNSDNSIIDTFEYIPEPYWGWTPKLKKDLQFVVVNYNPGSGGNQQHRSSSNINTISKYSDYVLNQLNEFISFREKKISLAPNQYVTTNWHYNKRAKILSQINHTSVSNDYDSIENYLGIDLVPWHTTNVKALNGYLNNNFPSIQKWSLDFAIEASKNASGIFKNKVLVRTNLNTFKKIFEDQFNNKFFVEVESKFLPSIVKNDNFKRIKINGSEVSIILLWGMRNSLPSVEFMKQMLKLI